MRRNFKSNNKWRFVKKGGEIIYLNLLRLTEFRETHMEGSEGAKPLEPEDRMGAFIAPA